MKKTTGCPVVFFCAGYQVLKRGPLPNPIIVPFFSQETCVASGSML